MKLVVISPESDDSRELTALPDLFAAGLERYHVRKPAWSREKLGAWLRAVPAEFQARLVLHQHHELAEEFGVGGVHFRDVGQVCDLTSAAEASGQRPDLLASSRALYASRSCHDLATLGAALGRFDSVFLSPIFPSLSKPGHAPRPDFPFTDLSTLLARRTPAQRRTAVLALGGITAARLPEVHALGFDGTAVLGAIWQAAEPLAAFIELQEASVLSCHAA